MSNEMIVLKRFSSSRVDYERYGGYLQRLANLNREPQLCFELIDNYYTDYPKVLQIGEQELYTYFKHINGINIPPTLKVFINTMFNIDISNKELILDVIERLLQTHLSVNILDKIAPIIDGKGKVGEILDLQNELDRYKSILRTPPIDIGKTYIWDVKTIIRNQITTQGLPFISQDLTTNIRGLRKKSLGLIFAFVDTGKTSFSVSNMVNFQKMYQGNRPLIYCGNEEDSERIAQRIIHAATNYSDDDITRVGHKKIRSILDAHGASKIKLIDNVTHIKHVQRILDKHNPRVLMIDQGTKVKMDSSRHVKDVQVLEALFGEYKLLCKIHDCSIICCAQGSAECEVKMYPTLGDIYSSKVAIPGELDWAIGIGVNVKNTKYAHLRYFNICKNKYGMKTSFVMKFNPPNCQFKEI